jgi:hypothetical protein
MVNPSTDPHGCPTVHPGTVPDARVGMVAVVVVAAGRVVVVAGRVVVVVGAGAMSAVSTPSHEVHEARSTVAVSQSEEERRIASVYEEDGRERCKSVHHRT